MLRLFSIDRVGPPALAALMLMAGLWLYRGIPLSRDDNQNLNFGRCWYQAYSSAEPPKCLSSQHTFIHSPLFELIQIGVAEVFKIKGWGEIFRTRHLVTFLLTIAATIALYIATGLLGLETRFRLAACLMFVLSPRLFPHYFYNSVDVGAAAFMLFSYVAMIRFFERQNFTRAAVLGIICGLSIAVRLTSLLIVGMTVLYLGFFSVSACYHGDRRKSGTYIGYGLLILVLSICVVIPLWPNLWASPLSAIPRIFAETSGLRVGIQRHYLGENITGRQPWHYNLIWIAVTLPVTYVVLFLAGTIRIAGNLFKSGLPRRKQIAEFSLLIWVVLPIAATIYCGPTLYNDWRHHYFLYPAIVIVAALGLHSLSGWTISLGNKRIAVASALLIFDLIFSLTYIVRNHPYEGLYFSPIVGGLPGAAGNFELDYWGISHAEALERLAAMDARPEIRCATSIPVMSNAIFMLPKEQTQRFKFGPPDEAEYYFSAVESVPHAPPGEGWKESFTINNQGVLLMTVYHRPLPLSPENPGRESPGL